MQRRVQVEAGFALAARITSTGSKALAAQQRASRTRLIEEGLQLDLRAGAEPSQRARVRLPVFKGRGGLVNGVNPVSNRPLLEALGGDA